MWWYSSLPVRNVRDVEESYDYVIVGGGTAGCVLANRLSEDKSVTVLVLERGGVQDGWITRIPLFSSHFASDGSRTRVWKSTPQAHAGNRIFELCGGNCLGGASKVNAMLYTRGVPAEYNSWSEAGHVGWSYDELQQYFIKSETDLDQDPNEADDFHGISGEWKNRSHKQSFWGHTPHIIAAAKALGVPYVDDLNSPLHPSHGCAKMHYTIDGAGRRSSTHSAFLPNEVANARKQHLHVCANALVTKIDVQKGEDGALRAEGVGIGPEEHLKQHDIAVLKDLPGVGSHLQDHLGVAVQFCVPLLDSMVKFQLRPWTIIRELFLYFFFGLGLLLCPVLELSIFLQSRLFAKGYRTVSQTKYDDDASLSINLPDIEIMPIAWADIKVKNTGAGGLGFLGIVLRPTSLGTVRLGSSDPHEDPVVDPNYLATEHDMALFRHSARWTLRLRDQIAARGYPISDNIVPASESDADIDAFVRSVCQTSMHYSSTCRMAPESDNGVVDDRLRVHGVRGLRVADSSVFPDVLSTHLQAATVVVAEKCADMVKEDHKGDI
ncbi:GMC oxidoreductase [Sparassis latifolia]